MLLFGTTLLTLALSADPAAAPSDASQLRASIRSVETVRYEATYRRTLSVALQTWVAEGTVAIRSSDGSAVRIDAEVRPPEKGEPFQATLFLHEGAWTFLDRGQRTYAQAADIERLGPAAVATAPLALDALRDPNSLSNVEDVKRLEDTSYAGESCRAFRVRQAADASEAKWYVSRTSQLPRLVSGARWLPRAERLVESLALRDLVVNPKLDADTFVPAIPNDYKQVDLTDLDVRPKPTPQPVASLGESIDPLREHFQANRGKLRLVGLFAPT